MSLQKSVQENDARAHPYLQDPLKQIVKRIPELEGIRPAVDQQALSMILRETGVRVDEFFHNVVDLVAHEEIKQVRLSSSGATRASEAVRESYLTLRHGNGTEASVDEFRMDAKGNRMNEVGATRGFLVTS